LYSHEIESLLKSKKIKIGDKVLVTKGKLEHVGILMPRIEMGDVSSLVIKLPNGYNIGIKYDRDTKVSRLETAWRLSQKKEPDVKKLVFDKALPTISIIGTGGTIASKIDYRSGGVYASFSAEDIANQIPQLKTVANIKAEQIMEIMSEDMSSEIWIEIAHKVAKEIESGSGGVIITHGTDTLHYTAAALSFMLRDLPVPVALVGAQRSSDRGSGDAALNVFCAANFVANSSIAEVCTVMHADMGDNFCYAIRGTKSRKLHTSRRDAFQPVNDTPLARIDSEGRIEILNTNYRLRGDKKVKVDDKLETKVALIKIYPGMDPSIIDYYIEKGYKGLVIEATGLGHIPTLNEKYSLLPKFEKAMHLGIPVVITSQCIHGRVHPTIYHNLRKLFTRGVIFAEDMLSEVAYIKLMFALAKFKDMHQIKEFMLTNIAGEITERTLSKDFVVK